VSALLEVEEVSKRFGGVVAVDDCSFAVAEGTITGLIGPNGSGKTTVFNVVTGYLPADAGRIRFAGSPVGRPDPTRLARQGLIRTFQQARIFPNLTVLENLALAAPETWWRSGRPRVSPSERTRGEQLLADFDLGGHASIAAAELSFGQRKLLEFATTLVGHPRIVLLDEPTAGVNPVLVETIERHIRRLNAEGLTFLIVEHDMTLVMRLCDPVIVLDAAARSPRDQPLRCNAILTSSTRTSEARPCRYSSRASWRATASAMCSRGSIWSQRPERSRA
jgi:neutral amino acid transport system ATP-binding protein